MSRNRCSCDRCKSKPGPGTLYERKIRLIRSYARNKHGQLAILIDEKRYALASYCRRCGVEETPMDFLDEYHPIFDYFEECSSCDFTGWDEDAGRQYSWSEFKLKLVDRTTFKNILYTRLLCWLWQKWYNYRNPKYEVVHNFKA